MADDVDLWEHLRHDDTLPMDVDEDEVAAAVAARRAADEQSVDELLAEIEALATADRPDDTDAGAADAPAAVAAPPVADAGAALGALRAAEADRPHRRRGWLRRRRPVSGPRVDPTGPGAGEVPAPPAVEADPVVVDADPPVDADDPVDTDPEAAAAAAPEVDDDTDPGARVIAIGRKARRIGGTGTDDDPTTDTTDTTDTDTDADAAVVVDRMRARRIAVRREEGLRRLRRLAWVLGLVVLFVDGAALAQTPLFDVDRIVVAGGPHVGEETLRWASGIHTGDALLTLDEHGAEASIEELTWVDHADVRREWPNTVRITVTERSPAALLQSSGIGSAMAVVDAGGRVLQIGGTVPLGLVTITGAPAALRQGEQLPDEVHDALQLALAAPARVPSAIRSVTPDLEAELVGGGTVRFGSLTDLDEKLRDLATLLARVDMRCVDVVDVKVPGTTTVSRRPC